MKKTFLKSATVGMLLLFTQGVNAQINLGDIVSKVASGTSASDLVSGITSVLSTNKQATTSSIVGTWAYSEPAIVFKSSNVLTSAAAKVAANKLESKLQTQIAKYGIKPGSFKITFNSDGTFSEVISSKTISGKWTISNGALKLTYAELKTISITTQLDGNSLLFVTDASKLLTMVKTVGNSSTNANIQTITSLMKSVNGMQAGLKLVKK